METVYTNVIEREHFDPTAYDMYWRFLAERQNIYVRRRHLTLEWPWTDDPILQAEFITNVYRILDPGTQCLVDHILSREGAATEDIVFNIMLYRLMGSTSSTHEHLGFQSASEFDSTAFEARLAELPDDYRIFGDAYRVASYTDEGSRSKVANVAAMFAYLAGGMEETVRRLSSARRVIEVYKVFDSMKGFGEFLSHQVVVDLLYPNARGEKIVPFGEDEFAKAGPGARRGIWAMLREGVKPSNMTLVMEWLRDNQEHEFFARDIRFAYLEGEDTSPRLMSLCDIQASLCEFFKYYRLWTGEKGVAVRKYLPEAASAPITGPRVTLTEDELEFVRDIGNCYTRPRSLYYDVDDAREAIVGQEGSTSAVLDGEDVGEVEVRRPSEPERQSSTTQALEVVMPNGQPLSVVININFNMGVTGKDADQ